MAKSYDNTRSDENLNKLNSELFEIRGILDKNLELLMNRGSKLQDIQSQAGALKLNSEKMRQGAERTRLQLQMRKYLVYAVVAIVLLLFLLLRYLAKRG